MIVSHPVCRCWLFLLALLLPASLFAQDEADLWQAVESGGHVVLLRHALAPGTGDPADFELDDCSTQRNLSDRGQDQARRIGERFREQGLTDLPVYSSQWCRCLETARLMDIGPVQPFQGLNSFFRNRSLQPQRVKAVTDLIREQAGGQSLVLVTHQVTITALTGVYPRSGEMVVAKWEEGELKVLGRLTTPS